MMVLSRRDLVLFIVGVLLCAVGAAALLRVSAPEKLALPEAVFVDTLAPGVVASMDSPLFTWSDGWQVDATGAQPPEPADPLLMPSGAMSFTYHGEQLSLLLEEGDYWAYLYVTVDGAPANLLPVSRWHDPAPDSPSGYISLYRPEDAGVHLVPVHHDDAVGENQEHSARIVLWRGWGDQPLRGVAVDTGALFDATTTTAGGRWLPVLLLVIGLWLMAPLLWAVARWLARLPSRSATLVRASQALLDDRWRVAALALGGCAFVVASLGVYWQLWWLCAMGLALLAAASLLRPALWYGALFFALPFYYRFALPILPGRSLNLVEVGAWIGLALAVAHGIVNITAAADGTLPVRRWPFRRWGVILLAAITSWALVSALQAQYVDLAVREWRTVFLAALLIAAGTLLTLRDTRRFGHNLAIIVGGWLLGATALAAVVMLLYPNPEVIIAAEGVQRLRGFYGSPNNLALYLDRTLAVTLAIALFARGRTLRIAAVVGALLQLAAMILTFSKGSLFIALPAMGLALWGAGYYGLRKSGRSTRVLWGLAAAGLLVALALIPFMGTERFSRIVDLASGTGFLRVNLWRAALQMAADHSLLGVGPDGFLYAYRSGYMLPQAWMEPNLNHPHNFVLDWLTRLGLPGLLLGIAFWATIVWNLWRGLQRRWGWMALNVGLLAATVAALAHGLIDLSYALPDLMAVWALFAVIPSFVVEEAEINDEA